MPKSKQKIKDRNDPYYNKNATPRKRRRLTHTSPVRRTVENSGLHLHCNKSYLANEQRKTNIRRLENVAV